MNENVLHLFGEPHRVNFEHIQVFDHHSYVESIDHCENLNMIAFIVNSFDFSEAPGVQIIVYESLIQESVFFNIGLKIKIKLNSTAMKILMNTII